MAVVMGERTGGTTYTLTYEKRTEAGRFEGVRMASATRLYEVFVHSVASRPGFLYPWNVRELIDTLVRPITQPHC